ncbi:MAG: CbiQ family ECF transporter T component [Thermoplasmata archaeon]
MILLPVGHIRTGSPGHDISAASAQGSWLTGLDTRVKLVSILFFIVAAALATLPVVVVSALCVAVGFAIASRVPAMPLARSYLGVLPIMLLASASMFVTRGFEAGAVMLARTSACVLPLLVLVEGTDTYDMFAGLRRLGLPAVMANLLMLTHKYILLLSDELSRMKVARRARGFAGGRSLLDRYGLKVLSFTAGMVLVRASWKAERAYDGLRSKGYTGEMVVKVRSPVRARDLMFASFFMSAAIVIASAQMGVLG